MEIDAAEGIEPLEWMLLSSVPTRTNEEVLERLAWYARRLTIESWHRVLKSGCRIEARQFGNVDRLVRATALFAVISWRILYATLRARLDGELPCDELLQGIEWRALYRRIRQAPHPDPVVGRSRALDWKARRLPRQKTRSTAWAHRHLAWFSDVA